MYTLTAAPEIHIQIVKRQLSRTLPQNYSTAECWMMLQRQTVDIHLTKQIHQHTPARQTRDTPSRYAKQRNCQPSQGLVILYISVCRPRARFSPYTTRTRPLSAALVATAAAAPSSHSICIRCASPDRIIMYAGRARASAPQRRRCGDESARTCVAYESALWRKWQCGGAEHWLRPHTDTQHTHLSRADIIC